MNVQNGKWEKLDTHYLNQSYRLRVPGGWLVKSIVETTNSQGGVAIAQNFISDPTHEWKL